MTRKRLLRLLVVCSTVVLWGGLFAASLAIAQVDLGHFTALCGAWGCLPPTAPLVSVHAMWLTLILGSAWLSRLAVPVLNWANLWLGMCTASMLATIILLSYDAYAYVDAGGSLADVGRRAMYRLVTWTDLPLVQIVIACAANWWVLCVPVRNRRRVRNGPAASNIPSLPQSSHTEQVDAAS